MKPREFSVMPKLRGGGEEAGHRRLTPPVGGVYRNSSCLQVPCPRVDRLNKERSLRGGRSRQRSRNRGLKNAFSQALHLGLPDRVILLLPTQLLRTKLREKRGSYSKQNPAAGGGER